MSVRHYPANEMTSLIERALTPRLSTAPLLSKSNMATMRLTSHMLKPFKVLFFLFMGREKSLFSFSEHMHKCAEKSTRKNKTKKTQKVICLPVSQV